MEKQCRDLISMVIVLLLSIAPRMNASSGAGPSGRLGIETPQVRPGVTANRDLKMDLKLISLDLLVLNPGDSIYQANRPLTMDSWVRLFVRYKNAGILPIDLNGVKWGVVEGPILDSRDFSVPKTLKSGEEDSDVLDYFGPGTLEPKAYLIKVGLDCTGKLAETDKSNNSLVRSFEVKPSTLYSGLPDMRIQQVQANVLSSCGKTRSYQIIATAVNAGTAPAAMDANNVIHVDPPLKTNFQTGTHTVKPKEVITVKYEADLEAGSTHQFTFMADQLQQLKESNETNNSYVLTLKVPPVEANEKGDLTVSAAFLEFVQSNQTYWLVVRIKNLGPNPVTLCKDMVVWETSRHPPDFSMIGVMSDSRTLKPGEVCEPSTSAFYQMPKGTYTFIIQVDPRNLLEETNKSNNIYILTARVPEDLRKR